MKIIKFDQIANKMSDTEPCPIIQAQCKYYIYEYDINDELAVSLCSHPDNPKGNCVHSLCPLTNEKYTWINLLLKNENMTLACGRYK